MNQNEFLYWLQGTIDASKSDFCDVIIEEKIKEVRDREDQEKKRVKPESKDALYNPLAYYEHLRMPSRDTLGFKFKKIEPEVESKEKEESESAKNWQQFVSDTTDLLSNDKKTEFDVRCNAAFDKSFDEVAAQLDPSQGKVYTKAEMFDLTGDPIYMDESLSFKIRKVNFGEGPKVTAGGGLGSAGEYQKPASVNLKAVMDEEVRKKFEELLKEAQENLSKENLPKEDDKFFLDEDYARVFIEGYLDGYPLIEDLEKWTSDDTDKVIGKIIEHAPTKLGQLIDTAAHACKKQMSLVRDRCHVEKHDVGQYAVSPGPDMKDAPKCFASALEVLAEDQMRSSVEGFVEGFASGDENFWGPKDIAETVKKIMETKPKTFTNIFDTAEDICLAKATELGLENENF